MNDGPPLPAGHRWATPEEIEAAVFGTIQLVAASEVRRGDLLVRTEDGRVRPALPGEKWFAVAPHDTPQGTRITLPSKA